MTARILKKISNKILVISPIYDKLEKLERVKKFIPFYEYIIFNGSLCFPYDNLNLVEQRIEKMDTFLQNYKVIYNLSHHDLLLSKYLYENSIGSNIQNWLMDKPNVIIIEFKNQTTTIVTGGGVIPSMDRKSLTNNLETSFVSNIEGVPWHQKYNGLYGYIISNNPLTFQKPQFHRYSAQIGNDYGPETEVYAQEVSPFGLKRTILL
jgi:hypothetical protein